MVFIIFEMMRDDESDRDNTIQKRQERGKEKKRCTNNTMTFLIIIMLKQTFLATSRYSVLLHSLVDYNFNFIFTS